MTFDVEQLHTVLLNSKNHNDSVKIMSHPKNASPSSTPPVEHTEHMNMKEYRQTSVVGLPPNQEHGPLVDHKIPQADVVQAQPDLFWSRTRHTLREPLAEFFGRYSSMKLL